MKVEVVYLHSAILIAGYGSVDVKFKAEKGIDMTTSELGVVMKVTKQNLDDTWIIPWANVKNVKVIADGKKEK